MKIMYTEEFLKQPPGTFFRKFEPVIVGELMVKGKSIYNRDFFYLSFDWLQEGTGIEENIYKAIADSSYDFTVEFDVMARDGLFERDQQYVVYSKEEITKLINLLTTINKGEYNWDE